MGFPIKPNLKIDSRVSMLNAVDQIKILPFFPNNIKNLSISELCAPGMLFGGNYDEGCWEWKGPVIRQKTAAYGKFFRRKAGFVSLELLADFLNYRRYSYPIKAGSTDEMLLEIIKENDSLTSTELKKLVFGNRKRTRWDELPESNLMIPANSKSKSLESPLQRLQMGGWILISDFEYKKTRSGERYGWGVARYSTPEVHFGDSLLMPSDRNPLESLQNIIDKMKKIWPNVSQKNWEKLLK
ncbi:MAG: hypothetical protein J1F16_00745 [Muribaculaceae bacterium]|nr:hypothetical protein [Muribaculaceae bacterium]